ncbi:MAG: caspase family protein [Burkholderiaceae bacterium]
MVKKFILIALCLPAISISQSVLPQCRGDRLTTPWTDCRGSLTFATGNKYIGEFSNNKYHGRGLYISANGRFTYEGNFSNGGFNGKGVESFSDGITYVGEFRDDFRHGNGIEYGKAGEVLKSGRWERGHLVENLRLDPESFPLRTGAGALAAALNRLPQTNSSWISSLDKAVREELQRWLDVSPSGVEEIPQPAYPDAISLKQEPWESNKEFEERVERARSERGQLLERIQSEYRKKVQERNERVARFNQQRQEREAKLAERRRELIQAGIEILNPPISLSQFTFDQASGNLLVSVQVEDLGTQVLAFSGTSQDFRKGVLRDSSNIAYKPEFRVSDAGEISIDSLFVDAFGSSARGVPSNTAMNSAPIAVITTRVETGTTVVQQSALTIDRNQVEQISYREENALLRKRLEEQRLQQERALVSEQAKAAAEIARLRAEVDAQKRLPPTRAAVSSSVISSAHALVIGNSAYSGSDRLANPVNDARAMSTKLRAMGFVVTEILNAGREQMVSGLVEFSRKASKADLTLLFYAGHGVQIAGTNYMVPVDMRLTDPAKATLQAVSLTQVVEHYLPGKTRLVFLDACRDNPLMNSGSRGMTRGLAPINAAEGTLIAYATKDGQTADDGVGQTNSPFTAALLQHLGDPDDIAVVLRTVRAKVMQSTNNRQQPWEYGSLTGGSLVLSAIKP